MNITYDVRHLAGMSQVVGGDDRPLGFVIVNNETRQAYEASWSGDSYGVLEDGKGAPVDYPSVDEAVAGIVAVWERRGFACTYVPRT